GRPVRAVPHDVGPSVQVAEFGDRRPLNGYSQAAVLSNNDAGPSNQETLPFSQPTYEQSVHQGLGQHDPCTSQSGTPYYLPQGNFINDQGQGSFSAEPTVPSHIPVPVPEDDQITFTAASLTGQQNGHFSLSTTDAPVTSYPVAGVAGTSSDGVSLGTSSPNHVQTDMLSGLTPIEVCFLQYVMGIILKNITYHHELFIFLEKGIAPASSSRIILWKLFLPFSM
uniref:Uncharacterized protein n=1 Tax=Aegilops tauschii subsp. strangulata TaxID=200361 RepID=A0A453LY38_AEGTS